MRNLITILVAFILMICCIEQLNLFELTIKGEVPEEFVSLDASFLPQELASYLRERHIRFEFYKLPNYVKDFLTLNSDYSVVYRSRPKYTLLLYAPLEQDSKSNGFSYFYETLKEEIKTYSDYYVVLFHYADKKDKIYSNSYDNKAVIALMEHCHYFCLINPNDNTLFTFKNLSITEVDAIKALLQQFKFLLDE